MEAVGLRNVAVTLRYQSSGAGEHQVIDASGLKPDGTPFIQSTLPFTGDPVSRARILAAVLTATTGSQAPAVSAPAAHTPLAAIPERKPMALAEKMASLASRMHAVPKALEARADALTPRLDALEKTGGLTFDGLESVIRDAEAGVSAAESAMRALTNGGPPLSGSVDSQSGSKG